MASAPSAFRSSTSSLALSATAPTARSSLASAALLAPSSHSSGAMRRVSGIHGSGHIGSLASSGSGSAQLQPALNAHSPLPSLTALQPLAMIAQRKPLQPTGKMPQPNRTTVDRTTSTQTPAHTPLSKAHTLSLSLSLSLSLQAILSPSAAVSAVCAVLVLRVFSR